MHHWIALELIHNITLSGNAYGRGRGENEAIHCAPCVGPIFPLYNPYRGGGSLYVDALRTKEETTIELKKVLKKISCIFF